MTFRLQLEALLATALLMTLASCSRTEVSTPAASPERVAAFKALDKKYNEAVDAYHAEAGQRREAYEIGDDATKAKIEAQMAGFMETFDSSSADLMEQFSALAEENLKDQVAFDSLRSIVACSKIDEVRSAGLARLLEHHLATPDLKSVPVLLWRETVESESALKKIREESPHPESKAAATLALAQLYQSVLEQKQNTELVDGTEISDFVMNVNVTEDDLKAMFAQLTTGEFGNLTYRGGTYRDFLNGVDRVMVGQVAPEIEGPDLDGEFFKLSDYRGKVVMVSFWADW